MGERVGGRKRERKSEESRRDGRGREEGRNVAERIRRELALRWRSLRWPERAFG